MSEIKFRAGDGTSLWYSDEFDSLEDFFGYSGYEYLEQYITRPDNKGKDIYAGDNLQYEGSPIYTVTWQKDRWQMCGTKNGNGFCVDIPDYMTIVGTIHDGEVK